MKVGYTWMMYGRRIWNERIEEDYGYNWGLFELTTIPTEKRVSLRLFVTVPDISLLVLLGFE